MITCPIEIRRKGRLVSINRYQPFPSYFVEYYIAKRKEMSYNKLNNVQLGGVS